MYEEVEEEDHESLNLLDCNLVVRSYLKYCEEDRVAVVRKKEKEKDELDIFCCFLRIKGKMSQFLSSPYNLGQNKNRAVTNEYTASP